MTAIVKCIKLNDRLVSSQKNVTKKTYLYTFILAIVSLETCLKMLCTSVSQRKMNLRFGKSRVEVCRLYTNRINATTHSGIHFVRR